MKANRNEKVFRFWQKLNHLPLSDYLKYQSHFKNLCGGWFNGITIENGEVKPIYEY